MYQDLLNKRKNKVCSKGYSLLEILMAMLIFGLVTTSICTPISNSMYLTSNNKSINTANTLAKSYLRDMQNAWKLQIDFDEGALITADDSYTENGFYTVTVTTEDLETDDDANVILRRVNIVYTDAGENVLSELYFDFNRPGSV